MKGMRRKKSIRGEVIAQDIAQINLKIVKPGAKPLAEIFGKTAEAPKAEEKK
ncbi:Ribosomal protein S6e [uncultured archaeon]|nr:Ribosomal protein S6e [uncultured archaeon]